MSFGLDFLKDATVEAVSTTQTRGGGVAKPKLPENADLRLFASGRIYPSKAFAEKYELEFVPKVNRTPEDMNATLEVVGNGMDIFSSNDWGMVQLEKEVIFACMVPKAAAKVDMWASTSYDKESGEPKASVFTQGANTFAKKRLVGMIADAYGIDWTKVEYVDLTFATQAEYQMISPNGLYNLPKLVAAGENKGKATYIRRENVNIFPLIVAEVKEVEVKDAPKTEAAPSLFAKKEETPTDASPEQPADVQDTPEPSSEAQAQSADMLAEDNAEKAPTDNEGDWALSESIQKPADQE